MSHKLPTERWVLQPETFAPRMFVTREDAGSDEPAIAIVIDRRYAAMIAAAPEMFRALSEAVDLIENHTMFDAAPMHALLAKARIPDIQIKGAA